MLRISGVNNLFCFMCQEPTICTLSTFLSYYLNKRKLKKANCTFVLRYMMIAYMNTVMILKMSSILIRTLKVINSRNSLSPDLFFLSIIAEWWNLIYASEKHLATVLKFIRDKSSNESGKPTCRVTSTESELLPQFDTDIVFCCKLKGNW